MNGILAFARSAVIADGFRGSLQLFCTDSVTVGRNVRLESPSGVLVSGADHPLSHWLAEAVCAVMWPFLMMGRSIRDWNILASGRGLEV